MLRTAVGMTHVLRSGLVMDCTSYFPLIVLGYHLDSRHTVSRCLTSLANGPPIYVFYVFYISYGVVTMDGDFLLHPLDYTQKLTRSTLAFKLSVSPAYYPWVTATLHSIHGYHKKHNDIWFSK